MKKHKVYTLTFHNNTNFGAILQAYALAKYLNNQEDIDCEVLNYRPIGWDKSWHLFHWKKDLRTILRNFYMMAQFKLLINLKRKHKLLRNFVLKNIPVSDKIYYRNDIISNPPQADAFVCGSDQIWNLRFCWNDTTYLLDFVKKGSAKKLAYAASIADPWSDEQCKICKPILEELDGIAIRENGDLPQLQAIVPQKKPIVVCDPVFLLGKSEWEAVASSKLCPKEPYILCYFLGTGHFDAKAVAKIREILGLKLVYLNLNALDKFKSDEVIRVADPFDFIGLISNATHVITNSFHASAFSIIFHRNFSFIPKSHANARVKNLIEQFKINDVMVTPETIEGVTKESIITDYSSTDIAIKEFTDFSKKYLLDILYGRK